MILQPTSDLHLEFDSSYRLFNTTKADVAVLAGDTLVAADLLRPFTSSKAYIKQDLIEFFEIISKEFKHTIIVAGNHEHYHGKFPTTIPILKEFLSRWDNITLLDKEFITIEGKVFYGATFWTDYGKGNAMALQMARHYLNDYRLIKNSEDNYMQLQAETLYKDHRKSIARLESKYADVVVSHHAPSFVSVDTRYLNDHHINWYYCSELEGLIKRTVPALWIHGHIHASNDYMVGDTRVISNPKGYPFNYGANLTFGKDFYVEI